MYESEMKQMQTLNTLAEPGGIVILGGTDDLMIPLCELKQAFFADQNLYNRSMCGLSVKDACKWYEACAASLHPETILLHIGIADTADFSEASDSFDREYRALLQCIRQRDRKCRIAVVSLRNPDNSAVVTEMNRHLRYIAESERCEYADISVNRVWNPLSTKETISFMNSMGFMHSVDNKRPLYDIVKILYSLIK